MFTGTGCSRVQGDKNGTFPKTETIRERKKLRAKTSWSRERRKGYYYNKQN